MPSIGDLTEGEGGREDRPPAVKPCSDCGLCCKLLLINALAKPRGVLCGHFAKGSGCTIDADKPGECRKFQCMWTLSDELGEEWRPNRAGFLLWSDAPGRLIVEVDRSRPDAFRKAPYYAKLKAWADRRGPAPLEVLVRVAGRMLVLFPESEVDLGPFRPDCSVSSGYLVSAGRRRPFAEYVAV